MHSMSLIPFKFGTGSKSLQGGIELLYKWACQTFKLCPGQLNIAHTVEARRQLYGSTLQAGQLVFGMSDGLCELLQLSSVQAATSRSSCGHAGWRLDCRHGTRCSRVHAAGNKQGTAIFRGQIVVKHQGSQLGCACMPHHQIAVPSASLTMRPTA